MNTLSHKGFKASIAFDEDDNVLVGRILGINDVIGFHADSVEGLRAAFQEAVEDYVETCKKIGKAPEKAYSGRLMLRVDPKVHSRVAIAAEMAGKSLNQWSEEVLAAMSQRFIRHDIEIAAAMEDFERQISKAAEELELEGRKGDDNYAEARLAG
jgi:predicted HicB family RNase H-like nuclease